MRDALIALMATVGVFLFGCAPAQSVQRESGKVPARDSTIAGADSTVQQSQPEPADSGFSAGAEPLSRASKLMIRTCNNYLDVIPDSPKKMEVLGIKASVYYNNELFEKSREVYTDILAISPNGPEALDAVQMIAQSHYQEQHFEKAQKWYRKLRDISGEGENKEKAAARIAESIFRMAEVFESQQRFADAAEQYERVALEFPEASIADVALLNSGIAYEKRAEWSRAILMYQRLRQRHETSRLVPKAMFRTAKSYEKLLQWEKAAETYLRLAANHPESEFAEASLYNAGFSFENAQKLPEAAATFEKLAMVFPNSDEAADVLFRAGELYGKLKDWPNVTRVNQEFSRRYGNDADRVVQAQCMIGVALYMQSKTGEALNQLQLAISTYEKLRSPSTVNKYYAAKAQFTIAEIYHQQQIDIALRQPSSLYRRLLKQKSQLLENAVEAYSKVIKYNISDWTTRCIYQIGQIYEDFALGVFMQQRPKGLTLEETLALELGIAQALEEYFVDHALHYHEQNVKLGIKESIEDKHVLASKKKLTYLPAKAGETYLALVDIAIQSAPRENVQGFSLIAQKLQSLQKIAPYQEHAIDLFLKALELGAMYQEQNEFYDRASGLITKTSYTVGQTYADVVRIAREAPIPESFDPYEQFAYKTKLLKQIEEYEQNALANYLQTLQIADAYTIQDEFVNQTRSALAELLFFRGRSYDLLCIHAFMNPPYPANTSEAEKAEYRARFEEIGLRLQEQAFSIYREILAYQKKGVAQGPFVNHAYVRLYQNYPDEFGRRQEELVDKSLGAGPKWQTSTAAEHGWEALDFIDTAWISAQQSNFPDSAVIDSFPEPAPTPMRAGGQVAEEARAYFRRTFYLTQSPHDATLYLWASDSACAYLNGNRLTSDSAALAPGRIFLKDLKGQMRQGKNVLALKVSGNAASAGAVAPLLSIRINAVDYVPVFPGTDDPVDKQVVAEGQWTFPEIKNFSIPATANREHR